MGSDRATERTHRPLHCRGRRLSPLLRQKTTDLGCTAAAWCALLLAGTAPALAQQSVAGQVVDAQSLRPLPGASVVVVGANVGTTTDDLGGFRIEDVPSGDIILEVTLIGYRVLTETVQSGRTDLRLVLTRRPIEMQELIVTGTPGAVERRSLGNSIATISAADVVQTAPVSDLGDLINGRAAGVVVLPGTGMAGGGNQINIRGSSSIGLANQPLIYIDGVRVTNAEGSGLDVQGGGVISRINDLNPEEIESIEIIRGPAAATLYGTEASNGVVQIITKRGQASGRPHVDLRVRQGASWFSNPAERIGANFSRDSGTGEVIELNLVRQEQERGTPIFRTGHLQGYSANLNGGSDELQYFASVSFDKEEGMRVTNQTERFNGRVNLSVTPNEHWDVNVSTGFVDGTTDLSLEENGLLFSTIFGLPVLRETPSRGFLSAPPEAFEAAFPENFQELERFTGSVQINHRPTEWLTHRLTVGIDQTTVDNQRLTPRLDPQTAQFFRPTAEGTKLVQRGATTVNTVDYSATVDAGLTQTVGSSTSAGIQFFRTFNETVEAEGFDFPAAGLETVLATATRLGSEDFVENRTLGVYVQQRFSLNDRLFLTGALRGDDNSAFGEDFDFVVYPKVSGTWLLSEEPFWGVGFLDPFKLRAAFGASGRQPDAFSALRTFRPITGPGDAPAATPGSIGNPDLEPERGEELEVGFEASLFQERVGLDFTYYRQTTDNVILARDVAPSTGFISAQLVNTGKIRNQGIELLVSALAVSGRTADLNLTLSLSTTDNQILDLGDIGSIFLTGFPIAQQHRAGFPVQGFFVKKVVSAEIGADGRATNLMCDGGTGEAGLEVGGSPVPCGEAPRVFLGPPEPKYEGSFSSDLTVLDRFRLHAQVDFKGGHRRFDVNLWARCAVFAVCERRVFPEQFDPALVAEAQQGGGLTLTSSYVNDASFARLREVSGTYMLPQEVASVIGASQATITVAGRNLATWTDWTGLDPEGQALGAVGDQVGLDFEQAIFPQPVQVVTTVRVRF